MQRVILALAAAIAASLSAGGDQPAEWDIVIASPEEPGEPLIVSGAVFDDDGKTPLAGVEVYAFHTDKDGYYSRGGDESQPRLHGTMRTGSDGRFRFRTIRPGAYPGAGPPAHIHFQITAPGKGKRSFDLWFEGDPRIPSRNRARYSQNGRFSQIRPLVKGDDGVWRCARDFRLD